MSRPTTKRRPRSPEETFGAGKLVTAEWLRAQRLQHIREDNQKLREAEKRWRAGRAVLASEFIVPLPKQDPDDLRVRFWPFQPFSSQ
jgi:hypothetical protein